MVPGGYFYQLGRGAYRTSKVIEEMVGSVDKGFGSQAQAGVDGGVQALGQRLGHTGANGLKVHIGHGGHQGLFVQQGLAFEAAFLKNDRCTCLRHWPGGRWIH